MTGHSYLDKAGLSGSGKSTIVNLLLRLYQPVSGQIYMDGLPLDELDIRWLREKIGFVGQEPDLFNMDVKSNIKYGCPREVKDEVVDKSNKLLLLGRFSVILQFLSWMKPPVH